MPAIIAGDVKDALRPGNLTICRRGPRWLDVQRGGETVLKVTFTPDEDLDKPSPYDGVPTIDGMIANPREFVEYLSTLSGGRPLEGVD